MEAELQDAQPAEAVQAAAEVQNEQGKPKEPEKKREFLLPLLTVLLIILGVCEAAFWGFFGVSTYRNSLAARRRTEALRELEEGQAARGAAGGSVCGPNLKVENGTVTWQREEWVSVGRSPSRGDSSSQGGEKRMSRISVPRIPYTLAEMETEAETETKAETSKTPLPALPGNVSLGKDVPVST